MNGLYLSAKKSPCALSIPWTPFALQCSFAQIMIFPNLGTCQMCLVSRRMMKIVSTSRIFAKQMPDHLAIAYCYSDCHIFIVVKDRHQKRMRERAKWQKFVMVMRYECDKNIRILLTMRDTMPAHIDTTSLTFHKLAR